MGGNKIEKERIKKNKRPKYIFINYLKEISTREYKGKEGNLKKEDKRINVSRFDETDQKRMR